MAHRLKDDHKRTKAMNNVMEFVRDPYHIPWSIKGVFGLIWGVRLFMDIFEIFKELENLRDYSRC